MPSEKEESWRICASCHRSRIRRRGRSIHSISGSNTRCHIHSHIRHDTRLHMRRQIGSRISSRISSRFCSTIGSNNLSHRLVLQVSMFKT
jgi:hypothetical protein